MGTFGPLEYFELSKTKVIGTAANFTKTGDGTICSFITQVGSPHVTAINAGTWTFTCHASLSAVPSGGAQIQFELYKYNGSTFTFIDDSSFITLTTTSLTEYTTTITVPYTTLTLTDRLAIRVKSIGLGSETITFYTQSVNITSVATNFEVGVPFGTATNCSLDISVDQKEVTSATSAWFKEYKNDVASWTVKCDGFISLSNYSYLFLTQMQLARTPIAIKFSIDNDNGDGSAALGYTVFGGTANIVSLSLSGPVENTSTYSVSLQGTGPYSLTGTQVSPQGVVITGASVQMFEYVCTGSEGYTITFAGGIGLTCIDVTRGGIEVRKINPVGGLGTEDVNFNSSTGVLTFARPLEADEFIRILLK